jgi:predicted Zn-dependent protease
MSLEPTAVGYVLLAKAEELAGHGAEAQSAISRAKQLATDWNQAQQTANELLTF